MSRQIIITVLMVMTGVFLSSAHAAISTAERNALIQFYQDTGGDNWTSCNWKNPPRGRDGFSMPGTEDSWNGVDVQENHVSRLELIDNNLTGSIPSSIGDLPYLTTLSLYTNQLTGALPPEIGNLTRLKTLYLCCNQFSGEIPDTLQYLQSLEYLHLQDNRLSGSIPPSLSGLSNLKELYLDGNQLTGSIPADLETLSSLQTLRLDRNLLTGAIPPELGNLMNLITLGLDNNQLTGQMPSALSSLYFLETLSLQNNLLTGAIPASLGSLYHLTTLDLGNNTFTGTIPPELGYLSSLTRLNLQENQLTGTIPASFENLLMLEELELYNNQLSGSIPDGLAGLTRLVHLNLSMNQLTGSIPSEFGNLTALEYLGVYDNQLSGSIPESLGDLAALKSLAIWSNQFTGTIPAALGNLSHLEHLYMCCNQLSGTIPPELGNLSALTGMVLSSNQLTGTIPEELGNLVNLESIDLSDNSLEGGIPEEFGNLVHLTYIRLNSNELTGNIPAALGSLSDLEYLYLDNNHLQGEIPEEMGSLIRLKYLVISDNRLSGTIPEEILNLTALADGTEYEGSDFSYNALYTSDSNLKDFINSKQCGNTDWEATQTTAPTGLTAGTATGTSVSLSWQPITFSEGNGGYEIYYSTAAAGPYTRFKTTDGKTRTQETVTGLSVNTVYYFTLRTVSENYWNTVYSDYTGAVSATTTGSNEAPEAHAGYDQTVKTGDTVVLNGSESFDPDGNIAAYLWEQTAGPPVTIDDSSARIATFTAPQAGSTGESLTFRLTVTDTLGLFSTHDTTVTVYTSYIPSTEAGPDQWAKQGETVSLDGSESVDPDGRIMSYSWTQVSGTAVTLSDPSSSRPTFTAPSGSDSGLELIFELTAADDAGLTASDTVYVLVFRDNFPPDAVPGPDRYARQGTSVTLNGSASVDRDGSIVSYLWTQSGGPPVSLSSPSSAVLVFTAPQITAGSDTLQFQLAVTDDKGAADTGSVMVHVYDDTGPQVIAPVLSYPADNAINVSLTPNLGTEEFSDPDPADRHLKTDWQVSTASTFDSFVLSRTSYIFLTELEIPELTLRGKTTYYWRVRFYDSQGNASQWSDVSSFTTLDPKTDLNGNGIPDNYENQTVDLDNDGTADYEETDIKSINTAVGNGQMGVSIKEAVTIQSIEEIRVIDPDQISRIARPSRMPLGLFATKLLVADPGDATQVTIYFSQAADQDAVWLMYNSVTGWSDYSEYATFSTDRRSVRLQLKDGGYGDADGIANGIIVDPSGFGVASWITGSIIDAVTSQMITTATVAIQTLDLQLSTLDNGSFISMILPGTYDITVQAPGYQSQTLSGVEIAEAGIVDRTVSLTPEGTNDCSVSARINTVEKGYITGVWKKGGEDTTARGDRVVWGYFYADPDDVSWGSSNNPEVFAKIWYDASGRVDANFFHVSVPDIEVSSTYGNVPLQGMATTTDRYIRLYYNSDGSSGKSVNTEDGIPVTGYAPSHSPQSYAVINGLNIGATINTVESVGSIDAVWSMGGQDTTARGDQVVWGHFYASPDMVSWGSSNNPELFVKIWFDTSGRIDVNYFHVSVPDIEVYSDYISDGIYDNKGTTIMADRYIRHEYTAN